MTDYNCNAATKKHRDLFRRSRSPFTASLRQQPPTHVIAATAKREEGNGGTGGFRGLTRP